MSNVFGEDREIQNIGGYGYGGGGGIAIVIVLVVVVAVLWFLSREGHRDGHDGANFYGYPGAFPRDCGTCVKDMPDYLVDRDVLDQGCKDREATMADGEKTRALMVHLNERNEDKAYQALLYEGIKKDNIIQTLTLEKNIDGKIAGVYGAVEKLACNTPQRPPFYACGGEPEVYPYPPRRGRCDECA